MTNTVLEVYEYLDSIAPFELQESYDNAGLLVGDVEAVVTGVLICLDSTEAIIDEAIQKGCNLVIAHHPIIFSGLKQLIGENYIQRTIIKAIKNDIAIIAIHTNLDNVLTNGVNETIASKLKMTNISILAPKNQDITDEVAGAGVVGGLPEKMDTEEFFDFLKKQMQLSVIKHTDICFENIQKIAICGGSGGFLLEHAKAAGAQVFVTSDYKYHEFFDADGDIIIADIGHYESENHIKLIIKEFLNKKLPSFTILLSTENINPVNYY